MSSIYRMPLTEGEPYPMSEEAFRVFSEAHTSIRPLRYDSSVRQVNIIWPERTRPTEYDGGRELSFGQNILLGPLIHWSNEDNPRKLWPLYQTKLKTQFKEKFFSELILRVPGLVWSMNPESSMSAVLTTMVRELAGFSTNQEAIFATQSYPDVVKGLASRIWPVSVLAQASGGLSPALPLELKINLILSMVASLLANMMDEDTTVPPQRPKLGILALQTLGVPCDALTEGYDEMMHLSAAGRAALDKQEVSRQNGSVFWTNLTLHRRCIDCGGVMNTLSELEHHHQRNCPRHDRSARQERICSKCNVVANGIADTKLHFMSVCKQTVTARCAVCGEVGDQSLCLCGRNWDLVWGSVRTYIASDRNPMCSTKHLSVLQAILTLHERTQISFTNQLGNVWLDDTFDPLLAGVQREELTPTIINGILDQLPTLDEQGLISIPSADRTLAPDELLSLLNQGKPSGQLLDASLAWDHDGDLRNILASPATPARPHVTTRPSVKESPAPREAPHLQGSPAEEPPGASQPDGPETNQTSRVNAMLLQWGTASNEQKLRTLTIARQSPPLMALLSTANICTSENEVLSLMLQLTRGLQATTPHSGTSAGIQASTNVTAGVKGEPKFTPGIRLDGGDRQATSSSNLRLPAEDKQILCQNETHDTPIRFKTQIDKISHMIKLHSCPHKFLVSPSCQYYAEFESEMLSHIGEKHSTAQHSCALCDTNFNSESQRDAHVMASHLMCAVCRCYFRDGQHLRDHNDPVPCTAYAAAPAPEERKAPAYLAPQIKTDLEIYRREVPDPAALLSKSLTTMVEHMPGLDIVVKDEMIDSFKKICSMQKAVSFYEKFPHQSRKLKRPLLQPPNFLHPVGSKENLTKVQDFMGKGSKSLWSPSTSPKHFFQNFLELSEINQSIVRATAACSLTEKSATALLLQRMDSVTVWHLESRQFSPPHTWSYANILAVAQDTFYLLNLEDLAVSAEQAKKQSGESFAAFYCRAYKLLSTASLGRDAAERQNYIATNLRRLALRAAPFRVRQKLEDLEIRNGLTYSSTDIMEFVKAEEMSNLNPIHGESESELLGSYQTMEVKQRSKPKKKQNRAVKAVSTPAGALSVDTGRSTQLALPAPTPDTPAARAPNNQRWMRSKERSSPQSQGHQNVSGGVYNGDKNKFNDNKPYGKISTSIPAGPIHAPRDLYKQAKDTTAITTYVMEQKQKLGIPADDDAKYCWSCGAGHPAVPGVPPYHPRGRCRRVKRSDKVHFCPAPMNRRLFHSPENCPFKTRDARRVNTIRLVEDPVN